MGHRMLPIEFFPEQPSLPWQRNLGQNWRQLGLCMRYLQNFLCRLIQGVFGDAPSNGQSKFLSERLSLPRQRNLGHNELNLGLRKRYIEDLCVGQCDFFRFISVQAVSMRNYSKAHIRTSSSHKLNIRKIVIICQQNIRISSR